MDFLNHDVFIYGYKEAKYTMGFFFYFIFIFFISLYIFLCSFIHTGEIININEVILLLVSIVDYISALIEKKENMKCA